jgi:DNA-binding MarR family transcriptional regulator
MTSKNRILVKEFNTKDTNTDRILQILRNNPPLPPTTLAALTGLNFSKLSQRLKQLKRYGYVKCVYHRKLPFYGLTKVEETK